MNEASPIECHIECGPFTAASSQIFTGFALLARQGRVTVRVARSNRPWRILASVFSVVLGDGTRLVYDVQDSARIHADALEWCDRYFKRSYAPSVTPEAGSPKVSPLGLNYSVYTLGDWHLRRLIWNITRAKARGIPNAVRASLDLSGVLSRVTRRPVGRAACPVGAFEAPPSANDPPQVLLLTRTWDPAAVRDDAALTDAWHALNRKRATCIRLLRKEFGTRIVSGFAPTADAVRDYPDCVVEDERVARKGSYLTLMQSSDICVATTGLAGSNGWRLGEYVASSRAIVSERLMSQVPGAFAPDVNYSAFSTPEQSVEQAVALAEDRDRRRAMMQANHRYYEQFLRPDRLVSNTLAVASGG
jgi:hypothetical protein